MACPDSICYLVADIINLQPLINHQLCFILFFKATVKKNGCKKSYFLKSNFFCCKKYIAVTINFKATSLTAKSKNHTT